MDYSRFLNELSKARQPSRLRELTAIILSAKPSISNLVGGFPNPDTFPFAKISVELKDGTEIVVDGELLNTALQYGPSEGYPPLVATMKDFVERLHKPPPGVDRSLAITAGAQDPMCKTFEMLISRGDYVIADEYLYSGVVAILRPYQLKQLKVKGDADGLIPESLLEVLKPWGDPAELARRTDAVPKVLYVIPNGGNPVGTSISAERRQQIYKIAHDYNLIIVEDDPYYFIDYSGNRAPSFLSLDVDGRVIRFDSFSKILSGGLRLGAITGPTPLVRKVLSHIQVSNLFAIPTVQIIVHELLKMWEFDGFVRNAEKVAEFYRERRDFTHQTAKKWLTGLAEWNIPVAGMFLWIRIFGIKDTNDLVMKKLLQKRTGVLPGRTCTIDDVDTPFVRISFSIASDDEISEAFKNIAECIKELGISKNEIRG